MAHRIVVGISGGIAAYKTAALVSRLVQGGNRVSVAMTPSAEHFIGRAALAALCGQAPVVDSFDSRFPLGPHIELVDGADLLVIAPATAHILGSCAYGLGDGLLPTLYLQSECPVLMAPAMSTAMWSKPAVQRNVQQLRDDGVHFVGPDSGWLSCRRSGEGRMSEPDAILEACMALLIREES
ncbi:Coenzyme A biosynthesis bifunctional protein CoaBC [Pirellula sp. SH-Sr6A]|uniref:flavoprotein n=1 Tax=Pirellula sp. SH-Sr6A TaxID=1632865 RepID=UPI00078E65C6|nr:flavoprotein [Pirellula sp. SH-Sr6A]AMV30799.1 Coenzyme A biosynthesis bifunctional protein CoaBC [Pirellula sp. SH-Sr6A]